MTALVAALALAVLAAIVTTVLVLAHRHLAVDEDPRLEIVVDALPGIDCGACGHPGCRAFAEALLRGEALLAACSVSTPAMRDHIATFLGVDAGQVARRVARLACAGGRNVAPFHARYLGEKTCAAAAQVAGGGKACAWGCLGLADCERACDFDAIHMDRHDLPIVDEDACTACGDCVEACPKDLFRLMPEAEPLWVACNNPQIGNDLLDVCKVACTGCKKCVQDAPEWLRMEAGLPQRIAERAEPPRTAIDRCPTGAIVWIENGQPQTGLLAVRPRRQPDLPVLEP